MNTQHVPWHHRSVVVTGGAGFLGRALVRHLQNAGYTNIHVPRSREFDLTCPDAIQAMLVQMQPDLVIHLAALCGGIAANRDRPGDFFYQNLMMGTQLMEAARQGGVEKFVAVGTVCAYPKFTPAPFKEDALWDGYPEETNAPYGLAKKMLLVQAQAYRQQYGFNAIYVLPVNLYGPADNFDLHTSHVIPALIRKFITAREEGTPEVVCWGSGAGSREFLYVDDAARAIVLAAEQYDAPEPMNIGSGHEIRIADLAEMIRALTGYTGQLRWDTSQPDGQPRRVLDISRAQQQLGFNAAVSLEEGLRHTIEFYEQTHRPAVLL